MRALARQHPIVSFFVLAYALSWAVWIPLVVRGARVVPGGPVTQLPGLVGPAIAALIVLALAEGRDGVVLLLRRIVLVSSPPLRFFAYTLSPLLFIALGLLLARVAGRPLPQLRDFSEMSGLPALSLPVMALVLLVVDGIGEEAGWRGFALGRLQLRFGVVKGTLVLGLLWGAWHTPMFFLLDQFRALGAVAIVFGFGLSICAGSVVLAHVLNRTGGSVLAAALWHTGYNLASGTTAGSSMVGAVATAGVILWAATVLVLEWRRPLATSRLAVVGNIR